MSTKDSIDHIPAGTPSDSAVPTAECVVVALGEGSVRQDLVALRVGLDQVLADGRATLVIDLSRLSRLPSPTVAAILSAKRRCRARRIDMVVRQDGRPAHPLVERTGLAWVLSAPRHIAVPPSGERSR